jgi:hypothetical protein
MSGIPREKCGAGVSIENIFIENILEDVKVWPDLSRNVGGIDA